jgi:hypothetical protein
MPRSFREEIAMPRTFSMLFSRRRFRLADPDGRYVQVVADDLKMVTEWTTEERDAALFDDVVRDAVIATNPTLTPKE